MAASRTSSYGVPGSGVGVSGPAYAQADPRPEPLGVSVQGTQDGPTPAELRDAWQAYSGRFGSDDGPLQQQPGVPNLNVRSNRIRAIVNTGVDFLFGPPLTVRITDAEADADADAPEVRGQIRVSPEAKQAQLLADAVFGDDDQRMTLFSKIGINGGVYGHVFVKVVPPRRGAPSIENPPRLVLLNPETVALFTDPEDADLIVKYRIEYACQDARGQNIRRRQDISRVDPDDDDATLASGLGDDTTWRIQNSIASGATGGRFVPDGPALVWPHGLPPIVDWQNYPNPNSVWGQRDVTDGLVELNQQLRLVESNINKIGFLQGHPYLYATGADTGGLKPTPGQIIDLGAEDAQLRAVDASGDLAQLMAFAEMLRSDMDEESGVPGVATGRMQDLPRGQVSGITMRLLYAPLLARSEHKRRLYGQGIRQLVQTALCVCGVAYATVQQLDIQLGWQDPLPTDDLAGAQTAVALQQLGYSEHTLIDRTGGDPDVEAQWKAEEAQQQMDAAAHGQALPPAPLMPGPPSPGQQPPTDQAESSLGSATAGPKAGPSAGPPVNHPAAVAARARMVAANAGAKTAPTRSVKRGQKQNGG